MPNKAPQPTLMRNDRLQYHIMKKLFITIIVFTFGLVGCSDDKPVKVDGEKGAIKYMTEKCINNESEFKLTKFSREEYSSFCSCYWNILVTKYPSNEEEYFNKHGKNSPRLEKIQLEALKECNGPMPG